MGVGQCKLLNCNGEYLVRRCAVVRYPVRLQPELDRRCMGGGSNLRGVPRETIPCVAVASLSHLTAGGKMGHSFRAHHPTPPLPICIDFCPATTWTGEERLNGEERLFFS